MLLYLVQPESSRTFCLKVYKRIAVIFKREGFSRSVYSSVTEVACEALKCDRGRVCSSVTERLRGYFGRGRWIIPE